MIFSCRTVHNYTFLKRCNSNICQIINTNTCMIGARTLLVSPLPNSSLSNNQVDKNLTDKVKYELMKVVIYIIFSLL